MCTRGFSTGYVRVRGLRIFYRSLGEARRGTLLLVHGGPGGNHLAMLPFGDLAQFGFRVVWYDQSGCGQSQRPRGRAHYTIENYAKEAEGVRRALRLGKVHLVGYSFGVPIALEVAIRYPNSLASLCLGSGYASVHSLEEQEQKAYARAPARLRTIIDQSERAGNLLDPRYRKAVAEYGRLRRTSEGYPAMASRLRVAPWDVVEMIATFNPRIARFFVGDATSRVLSPIEGSMRGWDVRAQLRRIRIPTLVTVARFDLLDPQLSREIHRGIPGSRFAVFKKSGHDAPHDERDLYMETMRTFLGRVAAG